MVNFIPAALKSEYSHHEIGLRIGCIVAKCAVHMHCYGNGQRTGTGVRQYPVELQLVGRLIGELQHFIPTNHQRMPMYMWWRRRAHMPGRVLRSQK